MLGDTSSVSVLAGKKDSEVPAAVTDIGCEREINEDRYAVIDSPCGQAWIVCDGMGGEVGGELAAQLAIDAIRRGLESRSSQTSDDGLKFAIEEANRIIVLRRQNPAFSAMGTTVVGAIIKNKKVTITHLGDSRAYVIRGGEIEQLTCDHTYVQDLVTRGLISQEEALSHPQAHVLTKCLGAEPIIELEKKQFWIWQNGESEGDKLLLCSDGLYSLVSDEELAETVSKFSPQEACVSLVELAKERGGYDNITLAILPLKGELREECPDEVEQNDQPKIKTKSILVKARELSPSFWAKRLMITFFIFLIGGIVGTLMWLLHAMNA